MTVTHRTESLSSGTIVHVWSPPTQPTGLVQLQHGFGEYAERYLMEYRRLVPVLVGRGYEVWAIDMQGHGRSPGRRAVTDVRQAVDEHVAVRRHSCERVLPITLIGHSLGGLVTAASAIEDAEGVRQVILTSPVILSRTLPPLRLAMRALSVFAPGAELPGSPARLVHDPAVAERMARDPRIHHGTTTLKVASTALDTAHRMWGQVAGWSTPLTILHGTQDDAAAYSRSAAFTAAIGRPHATLLAYDGGYHEVLHDFPRDDAALDDLLAVLDGNPVTQTTRAHLQPRSAARKRVDGAWFTVIRRFIEPMQRMRRHQFEQLIPKAGSIVFLGDSISEGGLWNEWFPGAPVINRGISGETVADLISRVDTSIDAPTAVFLLIGTNDLTAGSSPDQVAARTRTLLARIRRRAPHASVVVQSVMPRQAPFAAEIRELNWLLTDLAREVDADYLDLWPALATTDESLRPDFTVDGLHLNGKGYAAWVEVLQPLVAGYAEQAGEAEA